MSTEQWSHVSRVIDFIMQQKPESPGAQGVRGQPEKPKKKKKPKVDQPIEQLRLF